MYHIEHTPYKFAQSRNLFPSKTFIVLSSVKMADGLHSKEILLILCWERANENKTLMIHEEFFPEMVDII